MSPRHFTARLIRFSLSCPLMSSAALSAHSDFLIREFQASRRLFSTIHVFDDRSVNSLCCRDTRPLRPHLYPLLQVEYLEITSFVSWACNHLAAIEHFRAVSNPPARGHGNHNDHTSCSPDDHHDRGTMSRGEVSSIQRGHYYSPKNGFPCHVSQV
nr:hypothetical protein CFP56_33567 [Quercus suber]